MKYEKAIAEIVSFKREHCFMTSSVISGCDIYDTIAGMCDGFSGNPMEGNFNCNDFNDGLPYDTDGGTFYPSGQGGVYFLCWSYKA